MNRADITDLWCTVTVHCGKRQHSHQFHFFKHVAKSILQLLSRDLVSRLPALGIRTVEVSGSTVCHGGTSPAPCFQFTFAAFLEFIIISVFSIWQTQMSASRSSQIFATLLSVTLRHAMISPLEEMVIWQLPQLQPP